MRSRVRERRTHGSVRGLRREPLVYSTEKCDNPFIMSEDTNACTHANS